MYSSCLKEGEELVLSSHYSLGLEYWHLVQGCRPINAQLLPGQFSHRQLKYTCQGIAPVVRHWEESYKSDSFTTTCSSFFFFLEELKLNVFHEVEFAQRNSPKASSPFIADTGFH